jgi:hypothetical protein
MKGFTMKTIKSITIAAPKVNLEPVMLQAEIMEQSHSANSLLLVEKLIACGKSIEPIEQDSNRKSAHSLFTQKIATELSTRKKHTLDSKGKVIASKTELAFTASTAAGYKSKFSKIIVFASNGFDFTPCAGMFLGEVYAYINGLESVPFWTKKAAGRHTATATKANEQKHGTLGQAATEATYHLTAKPDQFVKALPHSTQILLAIATLKALEIPVPKLLTSALSAKSALPTVGRKELSESRKRMLIAKAVGI